MSHTRLCVLAALAAALVAPGLAAAAERPAPAAEIEEVWVQDAATGRWDRLLPEQALAHRATAAEEARASRGKPGSAKAVGAARTLANSGCRTVGVARVGKTLFGFVAYKFWQYKHWCWSYPRVTGANAWTDVSNVDPNYRYGGVVSAYGEFYTWCCGDSRSGQYSHRTGRFDNCVLKYGCVGTEYPWVRIYAHGDGGFTYSTGS